MKTPKKPPARSTVVAQRINEYLRKFEADPTINVKRVYDPVSRAWRAPTNTFEGTSPYYKANARAGGGRVVITYVCYQSSSSLTLDRAETYLAWLDAGGVGRHRIDDAYPVPSPTETP